MYFLQQNIVRYLIGDRLKERRQDEEDDTIVLMSCFNQNCRASMTNAVILIMRIANCVARRPLEFLSILENHS